MLPPPAFRYIVRDACVTGSYTVWIQSAQAYIRICIAKGVYLQVKHFIRSVAFIPSLHDSSTPSSFFTQALTDCFISVSLFSASTSLFCSLCIHLSDNVFQSKWVLNLVAQACSCKRAGLWVKRLKREQSARWNSSWGGYVLDEVKWGQSCVCLGQSYYLRLSPGLTTQRKECGRQRERVGMLTLTLGRFLAFTTVTKSSAMATGSTSANSCLPSAVCSTSKLWIVLKWVLKFPTVLVVTSGAFLNF